MPGTSNVSSTSSSLPDSILDRSSTSLISDKKYLTAPWILFQSVGQEVLRPAVSRLVPQQLGVEDDCVEGRAQLVAHVGQELALGAVGDLRGLARLVELAHVAEDADGADHPPVRVAQGRGVERRR